MSSLRKIALLTIIMGVSFILNGCKITKILLPESIDNNTEFKVQLTVVSDIVPENNIHKGLVCVLLPKDWEVVSGVYSSDSGDGSFVKNEAWKDSVEGLYPSGSFNGGMKWVALVSDTGYTYKEPFTSEIELTIKSGDSEGSYDLGFLVTKATNGLLTYNSQYAPFSYPHRIGVPQGSVYQDTYEVTEAAEWNDLFDRREGWTGADGIYSIPMNGNEQPGQTNSEHLIIFSDTFIGNVDDSDKRINTVIVNNTAAYLTGNLPIEENTKFMWATDDNQAPCAIFIPDTPTSKTGDWYWLMDGIKIDDTFYVYGLRLERQAGALFDFKLNGCVLLSFNLDDDHNIVNIQQTDTPFYYEDGTTSYLLGQAIMPMNAESNNPGSDGYIYVYGPKEINGRKDLIVARCLPEDIANFDKYTFWNGEEWGNDFLASQSITEQISQEFSVTPLDDGKFLLVIQMGGSISIKIGESPIGPFGYNNFIYQCPETDISTSVFVYNAKAHPSLSPDDKLLISYNVNTLSLSENINIADIYRPRFIYLKINENANSISDSDEEVETGFSLCQNYPNPFNPKTNIIFTLQKTEVVSLDVFNPLGQKIDTILADEEMSKGQYKLEWDASHLASGIYFYTLKSKTYSLTKKMILIK